MIGRIKHKGLRLLYEENDWRGLNPKHAERIKKILSALEAAETADEVNLPGFYFHALTGDKKGFFSVRVNANWRITFSFERGKANDVNLEDYH